LKPTFENVCLSVKFWCVGRGQSPTDKECVAVYLHLAVEVGAADHYAEHGWRAEEEERAVQQTWRIRMWVCGCV